MVPGIVRSRNLLERGVIVLRRAAMALAAGEKFQPQRSRREIGVLIKGEVLRFHASLKQPEKRQLEDVAVDLHEVVRTCDLNQILGIADQWPRRNRSVECKDLLGFSAGLDEQSPVDRRHFKDAPHRQRKRPSCWLSM